MKIKKFEDLECWQETRKLMGMIYDITKIGPFIKDFQLKGQIIAGCIAIMNNIA